MRNTDVEKVLKGEYICKGTLSCPFTPDWLRRCEFEKEQGKKDAYNSLIARIGNRTLETINADKEAYAKQKQIELLEKVLKEAKRHLDEYDINSNDPYMQGYVEKCKRDVIWLEQELKRLLK